MLTFSLTKTKTIQLCDCIEYSAWHFSPISSQSSFLSTQQPGRDYIETCLHETLHDLAYCLISAGDMRVFLLHTFAYKDILLVFSKSMFYSDVHDSFLYNRWQT